MSTETMGFNKSSVLNNIAKNEPISYNSMNLFLDGCYFCNDIESAKLLVNSPQMYKLFIDDDNYYYNSYEMNTIMKKITLFNNIDIIDIIMHYTNEYIDNAKQQHAGSYIAAILYKYNFNITADKIVNKYYLYKGDIIINMCKNFCDLDKIKNIISKYHESIQYPYWRKWILTYCARNDYIELIEYLKQYYEYKKEDIFNILFNFSKSIKGSMELYVYIFNNYIDIIKNETSTIFNIIHELVHAENYPLIYFIFSKIQFNETELIDILTYIFDYPLFFDEIIENITDIMLNVWNIKTIELNRIYSKIDNENVFKYIEECHEQ